jgi:hypothetical protein
LEETGRARGGEGEDCQGEGEREEYQPVEESVEEREFFKESELEQVEESLSCDFCALLEDLLSEGRISGDAMRRNVTCSGSKRNCRPTRLAWLAISSIPERTSGHGSRCFWLLSLVSIHSTRSGTFTT